MGFAEALFPNIFVARLAVGAAAFVVYCFLAVGTTFKQYLVGVSLAVALIGVFLPSYCGKRSLYLLGIGGGIPVVVLMKPMLGQNVDGCLIVNMGGRLIVWPMPEPTEAACRDLAPEGTPGGVPALSRVVMISQIDIEQIKPPPKHGQGSVFAD